MPRVETLDDIEEVPCPHCDSRGWVGPRNAAPEQRRRCNLCSGTRYVLPVVRDAYLVWVDQMNLFGGDLAGQRPRNPVLGRLMDTGETPLTRESHLPPSST